MNSKEKGKRGELEFAKLLQAHGYKARRTAQYCGNTGEAADIVSNLPFHIEVKRVESLNVHKAMEQAVRDAKEKTPLLAHRKNGKEWLITFRAKDILPILRDR